MIPPITKDALPSARQIEADYFMREALRLAWDDLSVELYHVNYDGSFRTSLIKPGTSRMFWGEGNLTGDIENITAEQALQDIARYAEIFLPRKVSGGLKFSRRLRVTVESDDDLKQLLKEADENRDNPQSPYWRRLGFGAVLMELLHLANCASENVWVSLISNAPESDSDIRLILCLHTAKPTPYGMKAPASKTKKAYAECSLALHMRKDSIPKMLQEFVKRFDGAVGAIFPESAYLPDDYQKSLQEDLEPMLALFRARFPEWFVEQNERSDLHLASGEEQAFAWLMAA